MRVLVVSSIYALSVSAAIAAAGVSRDDIQIVAGSSPSHGTLDASIIPSPFVEDEDYDPRPLIDTEPLPKTLFVDNLTDRSLVRLHNKHDYG